MSDLRKEVETALGALAGVQDTTKEVQERVQKIRERILGGETTGDKIHDLLLVQYGEIDPKIDMFYRDLDKRVREHAGELVLAVGRKEEYRGCAGFGGERSPFAFSLEESLRLGILQEGGLLVEPANSTLECPCSFPVTNNTNAELSQSGRINMKLREGNILSFGLFGLLSLYEDLDKPLKYEGGFTRLHTKWRVSNMRKLEVKIGDEEVVGWFAQSYMNEKERTSRLAILGEMADMLGYELDDKEVAAAFREKKKARIENIKKELSELAAKKESGENIPQGDAESILKAALEEKIPPHENLRPIVTLADLCEAYGVVETHKQKD